MAKIAGIVVNILKCICGTPTNNCIYQERKFKYDVEELMNTLRVLNCRKEDLQTTVEVEAGEGKMVRREVQEWLQHVQYINDDVRHFLEKVQRIKWYKRACVDKLVCRKINVVNEMLEKGSFPEGLVIQRALIDEVIIPTENLEGQWQISTREKIWECLRCDEVGMVGVCGIGGIGKTTIMNNVHNDLQRETRFEKVIWATVSYPLNIFALQNEIARAMGETLADDEEVFLRSASLMQKMRRVRYVLLLDDLWESFSLKDVGIPEPTTRNGCKIVISSRSIEVCICLGCEIVKVQPLSPAESLNLFLNKVGREVLQISGLDEILKHILVECRGLPLAIVVIAGCMKGQLNIVQWKNALNELQDQIRSVQGTDDVIFNRLRFSYDRLRSLEVQCCFLYCSLFEEDYEFSRRELIEGWIDEGLIDELESRKASYDRGYAILNKLVMNCLLDKSADKIREMEGFKMHDVVRDMAIKSIAPSFRYMVKAGMKLIEVPDESEWPQDLEKVSLMRNKIFKIPFGFSPKCPSLSTLILSYNPLCEIPESFFEEMLGLKVLDLSSTLIETLPNSISKLKNLTALRLQSCERLKCLPSLASLSGLKKLDLNWAGIEEVPQGIETLMQLRYLDLLCPLLKEIPMGIVSNLPHLQYFNYS